jgi:trimethylamine--corrinoid protein Co-methyltransferase
MQPPIRPTVKLLSDKLIERVVSEAIDVLKKVGVLIEHEDVLSMLHDAGAKVDMAKRRAFISEEMIFKCLKSAPSRVTLYDRDGEASFQICGLDVYFTPGSAALNVFDAMLGRIRRATSDDAINIARLSDALNNIDLQSTAVVPSDVPYAIADRYRLFIVLTNSRKPIVTGTFAIDGFAPMREMLVAVRGSDEELRKKPLAIFDVCPSPPLKWSKLSAQCLVDCARHGIPAELVSMPLIGVSAPVTLTGALVQHTAENLSGIVIHQTARAGAPIIYGGSPGVFDMRFGTVAMSAIEAVMLTASYAQVGRYLGLPTHGYLGLSDAKLLDAQAGVEATIGTLIGALAGVNVIAGAGMIEFENCQSLEKLVLDNDICGMARRLIHGVVQRAEVMAEDLLCGIEEGDHFLTSPSTLKWMREELFFPSKAIDRLTKEAWEGAGGSETLRRCSAIVEEILSKHVPRLLPKETVSELIKIMRGEAKRYGVEHLPAVEKAMQ